MSDVLFGWRIDAIERSAREASLKANSAGGEVDQLRREVYELKREIERLKDAQWNVEGDISRRLEALEMREWNV